MHCKYCGNPIGLFVGLRRDGFCEPRHEELFKFCELTASREPEGFRPLPAEATQMDATLALPPEALFFRALTLPPDVPPRPLGLAQASSRTGRPAPFDSVAEPAAFDIATWCPIVKPPEREKSIALCRTAPQGHFHSYKPRPWQATIAALPPEKLSDLRSVPAGVSKLTLAGIVRLSLLSPGFRRWAPKGSIPRPKIADLSVGFRSSLRGLPDLESRLNVPRRLPVSPPAAWTPWRYSRGSETALRNRSNTPAAFGPEQFRVPAAAMCFSYTDVPALPPLTAGAISCRPAQRDLPAQPCPPWAGVLMPTPGGRLPQIRSRLHWQDPVLLRPLCGWDLFPQIDCERAPEFPAWNATAFSGPVNKVRPGANLVVMPHQPGSPSARMRGGQPEESKPASTAFHTFNPRPLPACALPSFDMDACEFPPAGGEALA